MLDDGWVSPVDRRGEAQVGTVGSQLVANPGSEDESGAPDNSEAPDSAGGPSRTRTVDPLIKSHFGDSSIEQHRAEYAALTRLMSSLPRVMMRVA
jgi:hypothetical protein